jgi:hypothetical protein
VHPRVYPGIQRHPDCFDSFFGIDNRGQLAVNSEYKWRYQDKWPCPAPRQHGRQCGFHVFPVKRDSTLLLKFAERGMQKVDIARVTPTSWK